MLSIVSYRFETISLGILFPVLSTKPLISCLLGLGRPTGIEVAGEFLIISPILLLEVNYQSCHLFSQSQSLANSILGCRSELDPFELGRVCCDIFLPERRPLVELPKIPNY